jgi:hypothetical protein
MDHVKEDAYWFAAGMTVDSFDILSITAVALIAFRDAGLVISIFADAIAMLPPNVGKDSPLLIMYVEIDMIAEMNFVGQSFRVEASLAPTSFSFPNVISMEDSHSAIGLETILMRETGRSQLAVIPKPLQYRSTIHVRSA